MEIVVTALKFVATVGKAAASVVGVQLATTTVAGMQAALAIGSAIIAGTAVLANKAMAMFEIDMPQVDSDASRQRTVKSTTEPYKIIYGETLVSGPISFIGMKGTNNEDLYHVIALAGHEVTDITDIYFDNELISDSAINSGSSAGGNVTSGIFGPRNSTTICIINKHLGTATQAADSMMVNAFTDYTSAHQGKGIAYIAMKWKLNEDSAEVWEKYAPSDIKAIVKGKPVYDPRLDTGGVGNNPADDNFITYSATVGSYVGQGQNPALILADYLINDDFGMGIASSKIDWNAIVTAANGCDVSVDVPNNATEKRFTCNGVLFGTDSHRRNITKILSSMNGSLVYSNGKYVLHAGIFEAATEDLNEDDLIAAIGIKTSFERSDRFNTIKGLFVDPAQNHKSSEFPKVQLADAVNRDNQEILEKEVQYPMTNSSYMAQRLSYKLIKLSDQQKVVSFPANLSALRIKAGDRVRVSVEELSWSNKVFQCVGWTFSDEGGVNLTLREDAQSAYDDPSVTPTNEYSTITASGDITDAFRGVPSPSGLSATAGLKNIELNWVNPLRPADYGTIYVYASPNSNFSSAVKIGETDGTQFIHDGSNPVDSVSVDDVRHYWVRAIKNVGTDSSARSNLSNSDSATVGAIEWTDVANPTIGIDLNNDDSISINLGSSDSTSGQAVAQSGISEDVTITQGGIRMNQGGSIRGGQTSYNSGEGFFLGYDTDKYKFSIRNSDSEALTFDGDDLTITGTVNASAGSIGNSVTVGGTAASTVASDSAAGSQAADQISLLPRADDSEWTVGTGAKGIWTLNGDTSENAVVVETGPHGELERIWKATSTDGSGADGGFQNISTPNQFPIVSDTTYRFSLFIKQDNTNGTIYLGAYNFNQGSTLSLYKYDGTGADTNKYWFGGDLPTQGEWYLLVGFINPSNTNSNSGKGGIYNVATGVKVTAFDDFRFSGDGSETDATTFAVRTYNYYAVASPTSIVRWAHPRVDRLDRRAPSIAELLRGWTSLAEPINAGVTITGGGITMDSGGAIKGGQTAFDTGTGFFLGYDADSPAGYKLSVGNASTNSLTFEDGALSVSGTVNASAGAFTGDVSTDSKFIAGSGDATTVIDGAASATYRIFSGAAQAESENAPFQVKPDGSVFAKNITVFDSSGNILLNQDGLGAAALAGISLTSGTAVDKVSGVLSGDGGEMTLTLDQTATVTLETKFAIYDNSVGTLYLRGTGATSSAALSDITNATLNIVYSLQTDGGSYSTAATKPITFTSTDSTPSSTEVYVTAVQVGGSYLTILMDAGGALEYIANTSTYGATAYVVTSHTFTNLPAGVHKVKLSSTITGSGSPDAAGQSTSNRLYELTSSAINFVESAANVFANGTPSVPTGGGTVSGNLVITGDLTVNGTTTTVDTDNLTVKDNNITLNYSTGDSSSTANNAGITIQDGVDASTDATILWKTASDTFEFSHGATFAGTISSGAITSSGNLNLTSTTPIIDLIADANNDSTIRLRESGTGIVGAELIYDGSGNEFQFKIGNNSANTAFTIARDTGQTTFAQNATFAGTISSGAITSTGDITTGYAKTISMDYAPSSGDYHKGMSGLNQSSGTARGLHLFNYDADSNEGIKFWVGTNASRSQALHIASDTNATFAGTISSGAITSSGSSLFTSSSGNPTVWLYSNRPTLAFTDTNNFTDNDDQYIIRAGSDNLQFQWYDASIPNTFTNLTLTSDGDATFAGDVFLNGSTFKQAAPVYKGTIGGVNSSSYTTAFKVQGRNLGSAIRASFSGTSGSVVVNVAADIMVGHYQDILIKTDATYYTKLTIKVICDDDDDFAVEIKHNGSSSTAIEVEVHPLNNETITFPTSHSITGTTLIHQAEFGITMSGTGGSTANIETDGTITSGAINSSSTIKSESASGGFIKLKRADTATFDNNDIGAIDFEHTDSDDAGVAATILVAGDGSTGGAKMRFYTGTPTTRAARLTIDSEGSVSVPSQTKFYFDGGTSTYIQETEADDLRIFVGGHQMIRFDEDANFISIDEDIRLYTTGTATSSTNYPSSAIYFQASGWDVNGSVAKSEDFIVQAEAESSNYPDINLVFYEESVASGHKKLVLHGRGSGSAHQHPDSATFYGNVTINQTTDSTGGGLIVSQDSTFNAQVQADTFLSGVGSAASPAFQVGDDDSGFYDSGANEIGVALGGVLEYEFTPTQFDMTANNLVTTGTISSGIITANAGTGNIAANFESTDAACYINIKDNSSGTFGAMIGAVGDDILFAPNNVEKMRLYNTGKLLIGSDSGDSFNGNSYFRMQQSGISFYMQMKSDNDRSVGLLLGDTNDDFTGGFIYDNVNDNFELFANNNKRLELKANGYIVADSTSEVRMVLGSTGTYNANTSNWIRGNGSSLQFNSASGDYTWEVSGIGKMKLLTSGELNLGAVADKLAQPVFRKTVSGISNAGFTNICNVNGNFLSSAVQCSFTGTTGSVVVNVTAEILVNHYQDIVIKSTSGFYTTLTLRVISDNNEDFSIQAKTNHANSLSMNCEIRPLSNEVITFSGTAAESVRTLDHTCYHGIAHTSTGGPHVDYKTDGHITLYNNSSGTSHNSQLNMPRGGFITFYGNAAGHHGICSRQHTGGVTDDLRINSYAELSINLDSNSNNTTNADFLIGRHGGSTGNMDLLLRVSGENGDLTTEGNVTAYGSPSDIRLKESIQTIPDALSKVQKLRGVTFTYKKDGSRSTGLIAQELQEVLPEVVYTTEDVKTKEEHLAVRYGNVAGLLVESIKELKKENDELRAMLAQIMEKLDGDH